MKLLVIGSGGREHALSWKLAQSLHLQRLWCAPGSDAIGLERLAANGRAIECVPIGAEDLPALACFAETERVDLTVVGPDNPLALGVVDVFQSRGLRIWGPTRKAARFESSKAFAQGFLERHRIPTARAGVFSEVRPALEFVEELGGACAVKADGLALGKGVLICHEQGAAEDAVRRMLEGKMFGASSERIVVQELLQGREISVHAVCDGETFRLFPGAQDHKRAGEGDQGPNTGGMGCYSPVPFLSEAALEEIRRTILDPWLAGCREEGIDYHGVLYPGLMWTTKGPKVLEFNVRWGDPETQVFVTRMENDLVELIEAALGGRLKDFQFGWSPQVSVCVVMASAGYPGAYRKGLPICGLDEAAAVESTKVFHAGTAWSEDTWVTRGGRVLGVTAWGDDLPKARARAYEAVKCIDFEGAHYRSDIGTQGLAETTGSIAYAG